MPGYRQSAHLVGELVEHAHGLPRHCAEGRDPAVQRRAEVQGVHILVRVVDVIHAMRSRDDVLGADERS